MREIDFAALVAVGSLGFSRNSRRRYVCLEAGSSPFPYKLDRFLAYIEAMIVSLPEHHTHEACEL
jgi:hypothetical protein